MKTLAAILITAAVTAVAALALVYLPERARLHEARAALAEAETRLAEARSLLTVHAMHDEVLDLLEETQDPAAHERAMVQSTRFFDVVRAEAAAAASEEVRTVLSEVLGHRDAVTAALARRDPVVRSMLAGIRATLNPLLRAPGTEPAPAPPTTSPEGTAGSSR